MDFSPYAAVLLDLDGTLYHEDEALPGAVDLVRRLQAEHRPFACLTNSTTSPARLVTRLAGMGITVAADRIYTAAAAAADYVLAHFGNRPRVFNLATDGLRDLLDGRVAWVDDPADDCDAVVAGAPANAFAGFDRQRAALTLLRRRRTALIGICADRVYPSARGIEFGSGAFTTMLSYAADVRPTYCGKPEPVFFTELCRRLGADPARCLLIGDNLESDIAGGRGVGMDTVLVMTGVARPGDADRLPPDRQPGRVVADLTAL
jgi:HAD superfamily hydrolase (TIGR01450 family)